MKVLLDFLPTLLFFIAFKTFDGLYASAPDTFDALTWLDLSPDNEHAAILFATIIGILASIIQLTAQKLLRMPIERMQWISLGLIVFFGGATLLLNDASFIQWKPTIFNLLIAAAFLLSPVLSGKPLVEHLMGQHINVEPYVWKRLNFAWVVFFVILAALNIWVAKEFSVDTWVDFKLYGMTGLSIAFLFAQSLYLAKYMSEAEQQSEHK